MTAERGGRAWLPALAMAAACAVAPSPADARDVVVRSSDGTAIVATFSPAEGLAAGRRAPTVLVGHGFALNRMAATRSDELTGGTGSDDLRRAGFNTLTWDARGFGQSGGRVELDDPAFEGRDAVALVDFVARQPEAVLDGPGDPRVGMAGSSYGGGIQLVAAAIDRRIDAITPNITWNSVVASLYKDETLKTGLAGVLAAGGFLSSTAPGLVSPAGPQTGTVNPLLTSALVRGAATGTLSSEEVAFLAKAGAGERLRDVRAPTLLTEGTTDPIFSPGEAARNHAVLKRSGVPLKMIWFCGGHGPCLGDNGPDGHVRDAAIAWLKRYLNDDRSVDTGAPFEWIADNESRFRTAPDFPLAESGRLRGVGSGRLTVSPASDAVASGAVAIATPAVDAVNVDLAAPASAADVLGAPRVRITYAGTAQPAGAKLFAQVVDLVTGRVVGSQVTPIPVVLDGAEHTVERELEPIVSRAGPGSRLRVQITPASSVYARAQKGAGSVELRRVEASLPLVSTAPTGASPGVGSRATFPAARSCTSRRRVTITLPRLRRGERLRRIKIAVTGRATRVIEGARRRATVDLRGAPKGAFTVRLTVTGGRPGHRTRTVRDARRYRTCRPS